MSKTKLMKLIKFEKDIYSTIEFVVMTKTDYEQNSNVVAALTAAQVKIGE